jgi:hypothetical protein
MVSVFTSAAQLGFFSNVSSFSICYRKGQNARCKRAAFCDLASVPTGTPKNLEISWCPGLTGTPVLAAMHAAMTPARCAAPPAPAIITRNPRAAALRAELIHGVRARKHVTPL